MDYPSSTGDDLVINPRTNGEIYITNKKRGGFEYHCVDIRPDKISFTLWRLIEH